ncbi:hypothetical protein J6590_005289 [Homalodisca vitripennis]|nr:hypothetical protein J6590_005289 [Homalodisca vitripennis]
MKNLKAGNTQRQKNPNKENYVAQVGQCNCVGDALQWVKLSKSLRVFVLPSTLLPSPTHNFHIFVLVSKRSASS